MSETLYDRDFVQWAERNAELLRAGRFDQVAVCNVAGEIESLAKRDKRELRSSITLTIEHLLKLELLPDAFKHKNAQQWRTSIQKQRLAIGQLLEDSPSLRTSLTDEFLRKCYAGGMRQVAITDFEALAKAPQHSIFTWAEILEGNERDPPEGESAELLDDYADGQHTMAIVNDIASD